MPGVLSNVFKMFEPFDWGSPIFTVTAFLLGSAIGSFLNVAIYRLPRGLSVNEPKRSFCPTCNKNIPMLRNIPLFTWLAQAGKCAECKCRIPFRYFAVELLTAVLFLLMWLCFRDDPKEAVFYMLLMAVLVVVVFVDAELMLIPLQVTWLGTAFGVIAAVVVQHHLGVDGWKDGLIASAVGFAAGFGGLWAVVLLGKLAFGKKKIEFEGNVDWMLREPEDETDLEQELCFVIDDEAYGWSDLFFRKTDRLIIDGGEFCVDGEIISGDVMTISGETIEFDSKTINIEDLKSLSGKATKVTIPQEAMGMGDVYLMGMLGACFGWQSVMLIVFTACIFSLILAVVAKIGSGKHFPFGPSLALGAFCWIFWGWDAWNWIFKLMTQPAGL